MSGSDELRLIDTGSAVDVGCGYTLAWGVEADGSTWPLLIDSRQVEPQFVPHRPTHFRRLAPHELDGRLPDAFQQFRCGATTHTGKPCRLRVPGPHQQCRHHPETPIGPQAQPRTPSAHPGVDADPALFDVNPGSDQ